MAGAVMILRLRKRMSFARVNPISNEPCHTNQPQIFESNEDNAITSEPSGLKKSMSGFLDARREKARARGYDLHVQALLLPVIPLVMFLGAVMSPQRELNRLGIRGCPGSEFVNGLPGNMVTYAAITHALCVVSLVSMELLCGGQSQYLGIAGPPAEFEQEMARLQSAKVQLVLEASAWHTVRSGSGRNQTTRRVTTWRQNTRLEYSSSKDVSEAVDAKVIRLHPLTCVELVMTWTASSELQALIDKERDELSATARTKDSSYSVCLEGSLPGFPDHGRLAVLNRGETTLKGLALLTVLADCFGCGWSMRILMEFWTVHMKVQISKELA
eukprot:TRINITY_DN20218_c0_g1_i1.p1 TRINITY_DN20218_c0_g1~~TRINITY_DN20218_c0_g1_i1.p1  ORF type:complete len:329 (+),score=29.62 TRINITY_DN20218_c0_g1_i1:724-1710(+)